MMPPDDHTGMLNRVRRDDDPGWITHMCFRDLNRACIFSLPPNLIYLDLSYSGFQMATIPELVLRNKNSLQFVYLASNAIRFLPKPFYCPPKPH